MTALTMSMVWCAGLWKELRPRSSMIFLPPWFDVLLEGLPLLVREVGGADDA
jgi:hypothetical protein